MTSASSSPAGDSWRQIERNELPQIVGVLRGTLGVDRLIDGIAAEEPQVARRVDPLHRVTPSPGRGSYRRPTLRSISGRGRGRVRSCNPSPLVGGGDVFP